MSREKELFLAAWLLCIGYLLVTPSEQVNGWCLVAVLLLCQMEDDYLRKSDAK